MSAAIAGLAIGVISTGLSFAQAGKQKKLQAAAEAEADAAMEAARGKLEVNFAEQMSIKKEGYELERDANLSAGAQAMAAAAAGGQYDGKVVSGPAKNNMFNKRQQKFTGQDVSKIDFNNMSNRDFNAFKKSYGNNGELFNNKAYTGGYQEYMTGQDQLDYFNYLPNTQ